MSTDELQIKSAIIILRGQPVILASDLAIFFESSVSVVNQYRKRNERKFTEDYAFQLNVEDMENLKSQNAISRNQIAHGGSRHMPWAYTEHGVAMMSMGMKSDNAVRLSKVIIDTFVDYRRGTLLANPVVTGENALRHRRSLQEKLYGQIEQLLEVKIPASDGQTVRDELGTIASKSMAHIKAVLDSPVKNNEKISAEVSKILAEAEKFYAETRKLHAEADNLVLQNYQLRLEVIRDLREMAQQLERDDWIAVFDDGFGEAEKKMLPKLE